MESLAFPVPQGPRVSPDSLVSLGYPEEKETLASLELDFPDSLELKVSLVFLDSLDHPEDQGDLE